MKRMALVVSVLVLLAGVGSLSAQGFRLGIGGGVLLPTGDYGKADKLGWLAGADATYWLLGAPIGIRADVQYSQTSEKSGVAAHTSKIIGGLAEAVYAFGQKKDQIRPYIMGGIGYYNVKFDPAVGSSVSESKIGFGGGAGLAFKLGLGTRFFVDGKFVSVATTGGSTTFFPIRAGFRFGK